MASETDALLSSSNKDDPPQKSGRNGGTGFGQASLDHGGEAADSRNNTYGHNEDEKTATNQKSHENGHNIGAHLDKLASARRWIYVSHGLSQFTEDAWQFALILILAEVTHYQSLILVSTYGCVAHVSVCGLGATLGRFVDRTACRLTVAQVFLGAQTVSIVLATLCSYWALRRLQGVDVPQLQDEQEFMEEHANEFLQKHLYGVPWQDPGLVALLVALHVMGPLAQCLDRGFLVAMERDWIVCLAHSLKYKKIDTTKISLQAGVSSDDGNKTCDDAPTTTTSWLTETNVRLKQMDLSCRIVAPAVAGWIIAWFGNGSAPNATMTRRLGEEPLPPQESNLALAVVWVGGVNAASIVVEYVCSAHVYHMVDVLQEPKHVVVSTNGEETNNNQEEIGNGTNLIRNRGAVSASASEASRSRCFPFGVCMPQHEKEHSWSTYFSQRPICWGGLGLALLYVNALTFGALMTAYLVWKGMRLETVGLWRGISSGVGLLGTVAYHSSVQRTNSLVVTGLWSILVEQACLTLCLVSFFVQDYTISVSCLIAGVLGSRVGLWVFDISVTQMMQLAVPPRVSGVVGGTQQSLNALFQFASYALGVAFPNPSDFVVYAAAGYLAVALAALLYMGGITRNRAVLEEEHLVI